MIDHVGIVKMNFNEQRFCEEHNYLFGCSFKWKEIFKHATLSWEMGRLLFDSRNAYLYESKNQDHDFECNTVHMSIFGLCVCVMTSIRNRGIKQLTETNKKN